MNSDLADLLDSARQALRGLDVAAAEDKAWSLVVDLGWLLVSVPEELGGLGQGLAGACAFHGELGRSLVAAPYLSAMLAIDAVCDAGFADREQWLGRIFAGEYLAVPLAAPSVSISRERAGPLRLSGTVAALPSADKASHAVICAGADCVALIPLSHPGVTLTARPTWDLTRRLFDLRLADVELDEALVLASGSAAAAVAQRLAKHLDFALAADSVGGAGALLERTVEYLQTRRQFGRPLALFQALKHRCADLKAATSAAEALLLDGLGMAEDIDAGMISMQARSLACAVYSRVAEEALQLHGGIGMTSEHPCHLFLKRAMLNQHLGRASVDAAIGAALLAAS